MAPRASIEACRLTGLPDNLYGNAIAPGIAGSIRCLDDVCRQRNNGTPISPEDAYTTTYGLVLTPRFLPRFSFSVDRYKIQVNNIISYLGASFAVDGCVITGDPYYCSRLVRDPVTNQLTSTSTTAGYIQGGNLNAYRLYASGYDFQGQYSIPLGGTAGRLDFQMIGTLATDQGGQAAVNQPRINCVGYFGGSCSQPAPRWVHTARTSYASDGDGFSASLAWRHISGVTAGQNGGPNSTPATAVTDFTRIPAYDYFDLSLGFNIAKRMSLTAAVNNLFDRQQPILTNSYDYALSRGNTIPQRYDSLGTPRSSTRGLPWLLGKTAAGAPSAHPSAKTGRSSWSPRRASIRSHLSHQWVRTPGNPRASAATKMTCCRSLANFLMMFTSLFRTRTQASA